MTSGSFAHVYDALYGDPAFVEAQTGFLAGVIGPAPGSVLDLGCGTGTHLATFSRLGYRVVGVDADPLMLAVAVRKAPGAGLVCADLRRLPLTPSHTGFDAALCLESPLAYLLDDSELAGALHGIHRSLAEHARLVVDVFDYLGTLGARPITPQESHFETATMRVSVRESHHYAKQRRVWTMRQAFEVEEAAGRSRFEVVHRLRMRSIDEYAQALERAGFAVLDALTAYPQAPEALRHERRLILVARR